MPELLLDPPPDPPEGTMDALVEVSQLPPACFLTASNIQNDSKATTLYGNFSNTQYQAISPIVYESKAFQDATHGQPPPAIQATAFH